MNTEKYLFISTITASLLVLAGCSAQTATNTINENANIEVVTNTNETVSNENTNAEQGSEVDTTNWLTYENEEYGFSFKYPKEWTLEVLQEGGLGTDIGDIIIQSNMCEVYISVPHEKDDQARAVSMYNEALSTGSFGDDPVKKILLGSIPAVQYLNPKFAYESKGEIYQFVINGKLFSSTSSYDPGDESCAAISETILMTMQLDS